jgi:L-seryl-tRNA(Ser) seleniumtransferase
MLEESYRALPSVDLILRRPEIRSLMDVYAREPVTALVREVLRDERIRIGTGATAASEETVALHVVRRVSAEWIVSPRRVINATGVVLHTNLGRAPLSSDALDAVAWAAGYGDLELDLITGERLSRQTHARSLLKILTGAEDTHVATNAASALMLVLAAVARGREVIVSRGQSVEIGGGFRVPVVLRQSGARLVDVGTTNRTRLEDYADAVTTRTAAILHVHASNFRVVGFSEEVEQDRLARLAHAHGIPLIVDNGSGALLDTTHFGLAHEPTPIESLNAGADVVTFSGDKLLGGPQAGIVLGRTKLIARVAAHPLARAVRPDKLALTALSATLLAYVRGDAEMTIPVWRMISASKSSLARRASEWRARAAEAGLGVDLLDGLSTVGGGSLPGETLPTTLVVLPGWVKAGDLRAGRAPVIGRVHRNRVHLDPRTVFESEEDSLFETLYDVADRRQRRTTAIDSAI